MFQIAPKVVIQASPKIVREHLVNLECWWLGTRPDQLDGNIGPPTDGESVRVSMCERPVVARGESPTSPDGERMVAWRSATRTRRLLGLPISIAKGVSWELRPVDGGTQLSAYVWARFPRTVLGRLVEWCFTRVNGRRRVHEHTLRELRCIKKHVERRGVSGAPI